MEWWWYLIAMGVVCFILSEREKISDNTPPDKQQQIDLITGKVKARIHRNSGRIWVNEHDRKYSLIASSYRLSWSFGGMKPDTDYNGMSVTANVVDGSQQEVIAIRKMCKEKYDMDIHYELFGVEAVRYDWELEEEFDDALAEVLDKE